MPELVASPGDGEWGHGPAPSDLLRRTSAVLAELPPFDVAILVASGDEPLLHDAATAVVGAAGRRARRVAVEVDELLLRALARRGQSPRTQDAELAGALGTLAALVDDAVPGGRVVPVTVAARSEPLTLDATAVGILAAVEATGRDVVVVAAGELAGTAGAAGDDDLARGWDERAAAAFAAADVDSLRELGPDAAREVGADGWAPLTVLSALVDLRPLPTIRSSYHLAGRAGRLVAIAEPER